MKRFDIIPAIDIINGACVRLTKGDFNVSKTYNSNPAEVAKSFVDAGFTRLHVVDLDGAKLGKITNLEVLKNISASTTAEIDFGGGIKTIEDMQQVINAGAAYVTLGSIAVKNPALIDKAIQQFGSDKFFIGADVLNEQIKISGWLEDGGINLFDFLEKMTAKGINYFFCTDIQKDGMMEGASVDLYKKIIHRFPGIRLIASGGVSTLSDIEELKSAGCRGAIVGKAIYENLISLQDLAGEIEH